MSAMLGSVGKSALERYVASNPDFTGREEKGLLSLPGIEEREERNGLQVRAAPRRTILQSIDLNLTRTLFRILGQFESHSHSNYHKCGNLQQYGLQMPGTQL